MKNNSSRRSRFTIQIALHNTTEENSQLPNVWNWRPWKRHVRIWRLIRKQMAAKHEMFLMKMYPYSFLNWFDSGLKRYGVCGEWGTGGREWQWVGRVVHMYLLLKCLNIWRQ